MAQREPIRLGGLAGWPRAERQAGRIVAIVEPPAGLAGAGVNLLAGAGAQKPAG